jgi:ligand-binding SRPBCC domain-containing protein
MSVYVLERRQWVPTPLERTFELYADAFALERITPPWLGFRVTTPGPIDLGEGTLIDYSLRLHGVPIRWRSRIEAWDPPHRFVDVQVRGPYRLWHHTHTFAAVDGGTRLTDRVRYALPLGPLGELAHGLLVRRDLERIFDFRRDAVRELLAAGQKPTERAPTPYSPQINQPHLESGGVKRCSPT